MIVKFYIVVFCEKSQHEVLKLIAGPEAHIRESCTELCIGIVLEEMQVRSTEQRSTELNSMTCQSSHRYVENYKRKEAAGKVLWSSKPWRLNSPGFIGGSSRE